MSGENIIIKPNFCKMDLDITTNKTKTLESEPGIPELSKLYYDKYDFDQGGFVGMSDSMRKVYEKDVATFYKIFTGKNTVPDTVKTFSDIPLTAYHTQVDCGPNGMFNATFKGNTSKDRLFKIYAEHIQQMMKTTEENQNKLLDQIDKLFVFNENPVSKEREVTIKPNMSDMELQQIVEDTRNIIINLDIKCEQDFLEGLEIFEAIVEKQIMDTAVTRDSEMKSLAERKMSMVKEEFQQKPLESFAKEATTKVSSLAKNASETVTSLFSSEPVVEKILPVPASSLPSASLPSVPAAPSLPSPSLPSVPAAPSLPSVPAAPSALAPSALAPSALAPSALAPSALAPSLPSALV